MKYKALIMVFVTGLLIAMPIEAFALVDGPWENIIIEDVSRYGEYESCVQDELARFSKGIFPAVIENDQAATYKYIYQCIFFGNPNYSIYLSLEDMRIEEFEKEIERVSSVAGGELSDFEIMEDVYLLSGEPKYIDSLFDDEIFDGNGYFFELFKVNKEERRLEYFEVVN